MNQRKEPYDDTYRCLVKIHPGYFVVVHPDREELDQTQCRPESETVYDILHQDDGVITSESSCCPAHAFQDARKWISQHESALEQTES